MEIKKLYVIFKTHLDIGFTDFSANVTEKYMKDFIPNSVRTAKQLYEMGGQARLIWTTGSWLIDKYLKTQDSDAVAVLEEGIKNGYISWHGLPFTTHTELMSADTFKYGLSLSQKLDKRFQRKTIGAKMTDVPGHTKAIIPFLKEAGIEFLHIGVNNDCTVPAVPPIFRWQADNGDMINVMYNGNYGEFSPIGDSGVAIYFAHTGDNAGVQSPDEIIKIFDDLKAKMPNVEIVAGDLNDVALEVRKIENTLPIITKEIGDTWIHGIGTDPKKVSSFKALERLFKRLPDDSPDKEILGDALIMIPEHTWGVNVNLHLADHDNYDKYNFNLVRKSAPNYKKMEASWAEQRAYLTDAVNKLTEENKALAGQLLAQSERTPTVLSWMYKYSPNQMFEYAGYKFVVNNQGEIIHLEKDGKIFADRSHPLLSFVYEQFSANEYKRFVSQYIRNIHTWTYEDFTKPGIEKATDCYRRYEPESVSMITYYGKLRFRYIFPESAYREYGCPQSIEVDIIPAEDNSLLFDIAWFNKPANKAAEAIWVGFKPIAQNLRISKLGTAIDPQDVIDGGQCHLHGTDKGVSYDELDIESVDAALVAPEAPSLLNFNNHKPEKNAGVYFNLFNNVWGTNFPMWYDEDARFRFYLKIK